MAMYASFESLDPFLLSRRLPSFANSFRGLALESMLTLLSKKFIPFFLIAWIIGASPPWISCSLVYSHWLLFVVAKSKRIRLSTPDRGFADRLQIWICRSFLQRLSGSSDDSLLDQESRLVLSLVGMRTIMTLLFQLPWILLSCWPGSRFPVSPFLCCNSGLTRRR